MSNEKQDLLDKFKKAGYSVTEMSKQTKIPKDRIYKWYDGKGLPKLEDFRKLQGLWELQPNPTLDFHPGMEEYQMREEEIPMAPPYWAREVKRLENENIKLAEKLDNYEILIRALKKEMEVLKENSQINKAS